MATECADYIFYGGTIITMEEENPSAEALAVKGANILAVGKRDEVFALKGLSTEFVHLNARQTLLPGLIEPHSHAIMMAVLKSVSEFKSFFNFFSFFFFISLRAPTQIFIKAILVVFTLEP